MTAFPPDSRVGSDALAPVRAAMLGQARQQASRVRAQAAGEAQAVLSAARGHAAQITSQARAMGESDGRLAAGSRRAAADRAARRVVLGAQREAYEEFRRLVRVAVCALRTDPRYPRLLRALEVLARAAAGSSAVVTSPPSGGAVAQAPGRRVDCSLPRLAERAADALAAEVSSLWQE